MVSSGWEGLSARATASHIGLKFTLEQDCPGYSETAWILAERLTAKLAPRDSGAEGIQYNDWAGGYLAAGEDESRANHGRRRPRGRQGGRPVPAVVSLRLSCRSNPGCLPLIISTNWACPTWNSNMLGYAGASHRPSSSSLCSGSRRSTPSQLGLTLAVESGAYCNVLILNGCQTST